MGGKHKQAQRTKNNARPSSSGRSAELLGNTAPTFVGFTAVKDGGFVPVLPGFTISAEELDPNLNPNFHLVLKKMGKKDSTTKLKALQEFSELIQNSEPEAVKAVLPLWPRLYCHLAVDVEHRVREAAHQAQRAVVLRAKRNLAPYLRQLAGPWFTSQYDTYAPAATAAAQAFQDAFPPNKVTEAIVFCQGEIFNYIYDNLIVHTAQTLSSPKTMTSEEMEAKYQRMVISSLKGYALYLQRLPAEQIKAAEEINKKLISSKKFWKLSKHSCPLIRSAWFSVLISLCEKAPGLLADEVSHVALAVFNSLDETDPIVLPTVWEASLHVLTTIEDCWQQVSAEKIVLPKLWHILREGGQGNAATIFPNLLPFISKFPSSVCSDKQDFYDKFFSNMRQGMTQKSVLQSSSESNAVTKGYVECLQYTVMLYINDIDFCNFVLDNHLLSVIMLALKEQKFHLVSSAMFLQVSGLIYHWSHNCNNDEYKTLVQKFWATLSSLIIETLLPSNEDSLQSVSSPPSWFYDRLLDLCLCLKNPSFKRNRLKQKVKFSCEGEESEDTGTEPESPVDVVSSPSDEPLLVDQGLQLLVQNISASYVKISKQFGDPKIISYLARLIKSFKSKDLFLTLLHSEEQLRNENSLIMLYENVLYDWLKSENMCTEDVVHITFSLLEFLSPEDKNLILESLCKISNGSVLVWCVKISLEKRSDSTIQKWLYSSQLSQILVNLVNEIHEKTATDARYILKSCLSKTKDGELVISSETFSAILLEFLQLLQSPKCNSLCLTFITEILKSLYSGDIRLSPYLHSNSAAENLLLYMFQMECQDSKEAHDAWCNGVSALSRLHGSSSETFTLFSSKFAQVIKDQLLSEEDVVIEAIDDIVSTVLSYLCASVKCFPTDIEDKAKLWSDSVKLCSTFLDGIAYLLDNREQNLTAICLYAEQLKGLLRFGTLSDTITADCERKDTDYILHSVQYMKLTLFAVTLMSKLPDVCETVSEDEEQNTEQDKGNNAFSSDNVSVLEKHLLKILYSVSVCESFSRHYKSSVYYYKVFSKYSTLILRSELLLEKFEPAALDLVTHLTIERALQYGNLWLQTVLLLHTKLLKELDLNQLYEKLTSTMGSCNVGIIDVCQVFPSFVKVEDVRTEMTCLDIDKLMMVASWLNNLEENLPVEYSESVRNLLDSVLVWYQQEDKSELLFDCKVRWPEVKKVAAAARFMAAVVDKCPEILTADHWDAAVVCLASWMLTLKYSRGQLLSKNNSPPLVPSSASEVQSVTSRKPESFLLDHHGGAVFAIAVCELFNSLCVFFSNEKTLTDNDVKNFQAKLSQEWQDVFANDVHEVLISTFNTVAVSLEAHPLSLLDLPVLECIGEALLRVDTKYYVSEIKNSSDAVDAMVKRCCQIIYSPVIPLQLSAYHIFTRLLIPALIELDTPAAFAASEVDKEGEGLSLIKLQETLLHTQTVVDTMLLGIRVGNTCTTVCPFTDAYTYAAAYLLLWAAVLEMCGKAVSELRFQYATMLWNSGFLKSLLQNIFRLMPEQVLQIAHPKFKLQKTTEMFSSSPNLEFSQASSSEFLEHLSCWVYYSTSWRLPALVRQWWGEIEPRVASLVEQVTSVHCSPALCSEEMKSIQSKDMQQGNMVVKVHPTVREIIAVYKVDEARIELSMHLPNNYPLGPVRVESGKQFVDSGQWRNWMMQLTVFLTHQNGSIWDGLTLWKSNLDKKFEGLEECYICFSILHGTNFQKPRLCCSTCKKKFHSPCLYQWFHTSNKATCPICRNLF